MKLYRWSAVAIAFAAAAFAMVVFVDWPWAWPFIVTSWACSYMQARGPLANRKRMRRSEAAEILQLAHGIDRKLGGRREFEPFCDCPRCGVPTFHLFTAPVEYIDSRSDWVAGPGSLWVESDEDIRFAVFNKPGTYRVHHRETGRMVTKKRVTMVVPRECLSCQHEWTEKAA